MINLRCKLGFHKWQYMRAHEMRMRGCEVCGRRENQDVSISTKYWFLIDYAWREIVKEKAEGIPCSREWEFYKPKGRR